jgi:hypothetical protein
VTEPANYQQHQLCNMLLGLTKEVRESRKKIVQMRTSFNNVVLENASHKATIATMANKMNYMKDRQHITERKVSQLRTPPPQKRSSPKIGGLPKLHHASDVIVQAGMVQVWVGQKLVKSNILQYFCCPIAFISRYLLINQCNI